MFLLLDIGATNLRVAVSNSGLKLDRIMISKTPAKYEDGLKLIKAMSGELTQGHKPKLVCAGIASPLGTDKSKLLDFKKSDWTGQNFQKDLSKLLEAKVVLENDAALAALGEATYGAGKPAGIVAYLTISSGIGGARVVDNKIDPNTFGFEPKLQILNPEMQNFDVLASGTSIAKTYGKKGEDLNDAESWRAVEKWIAIGINNTIAFWSPDILVLGGPVVNNKNISLKRIQNLIKGNLKVIGKLPKIVKAELGQQSGLYGGLKLLKK